MSAAEQLEDPQGSTAPRRDALLEGEAMIEAQLTQPPEKTRVWFAVFPKLSLRLYR